jgi:hypothetical protein
LVTAAKAAAAAVWLQAETRAVAQKATAAAVVFLLQVALVRAAVVPAEQRAAEQARVAANLLSPHPSPS